MPELAEVEYYRKQWDVGLGQKVVRILWHREKRLFRGIDPKQFTEALTGATLRRSEARAKLMCFQFSQDRQRQASVWLGIHLGMTGKLRVESARFVPEKHEHLALVQKAHSLVFRDPRMFGRVHFHEGVEPPDWWAKLPPAVTSPEFSLQAVRDFLKRRARLAVKAALLVQERFPGVGNWMADEILWRARIAPEKLCGELTAKRAETLWHETREVCRIALETVAVDFSDPPEGWFFHERWSARGKCPRCRRPLKTSTVGGRTTRWCGRCQR